MGAHEPLTEMMLFVNHILWCAARIECIFGVIWNETKPPCGQEPLLATQAIAAVVHLWLGVCGCAGRKCARLLPLIMSGYEIPKRHFNVLAINSVLGAGLLSGIVWSLGPRFLEFIPEFVWWGFAFLVLFLPLYPVISLYTRVRKGKDLSFWRYLTGALVGAVVAPLIQILLIPTLL